MNIDLLSSASLAKPTFLPTEQANTSLPVADAGTGAYTDCLTTFN